MKGRPSFMSVFEVVALLLTLTVLFSYANYRFIKLLTTIPA
jgi:hypothetical protein